MKDLFDFILSFRRKLHSFPELSFKEYNTQRIIIKTLKKFNIKCKKVAKTGVLAETGRESKRKILLRADIDALPVMEKNKFSYRSKNAGIMHACGHDFNTAIILGTALFLKKENYDRKVYFLFQPAEEEGSGAEKVLKDKNFPEKIDYVFGVHIEPFIKTGFIGVKEGVLMANVDKFNIEIKGKGGHAAYPDKCKNPIDVFHSLYSDLRKIILEKIPPDEQAVLTVTRVMAGERFNVIPEKLFLEGTTRSLNNKIRNILIREIKKICKKFSRDKDIEIKLNYECLGEYLYNNPQAVKYAKEAVRKTGLKLFIVKKPSMGGDDFALYLKKIKGAYIYVGGGKRENNFPWHSPNFSPDENSIKYGVRLFLNLVKYINK